MIRRFIFLVIVLAALPGLLSCTPTQEAGAGNLTQLTSDLGDEYFPDWSPDSKSIIFEKASSDPISNEVWTMESDGSNKRRIPTIHPAGAPVYSPGGSRIAYVAFTKTSPRLSTEIWVIDADGGNPQQLSAETNWVMEFPVWSSDGSQISYTRAQDLSGGPGAELWIMNSDGSDKSQVLADLSGLVRKSWEPNTNRIVFEWERHIWIVNADGGGLRQLTDSKDGVERHPDWSPDGTRIVFESENRLGNGDMRQGIEVMRLDGTGRELILSSDINDSWDRIGEPTWSPDGSRIAFTVKNKTEDNLYDIWVMTLDD